MLCGSIYRPRRLALRCGAGLIGGEQDKKGSEYDRSYI